jgi:hypothetical protein
MSKWCILHSLSAINSGQQDGAIGSMMGVESPEATGFRLHAVVIPNKAAPDAAIPPN